MILQIYYIKWWVFIYAILDKEKRKKIDEKDQKWNISYIHNNKMNKNGKIKKLITWNIMIKILKKK